MATNIKINKKQRLVAVLLAACVLIQTYIFVPSVHAEDSLFSVATNHGYVALGGVHIDHSSSLKDNDDGTYTLSINLKSVYTKEAVNTVTFLAENGTYTVSQTGWYFVELWGGAGAGVDGAGQGGAAGHVYAKMYLEAGQTLFYTLGGNGETTKKSGTGGGVNGTGGGHGLVGDYTVGGGGGYSALYLYDNGEFESTYGSLDVEAISEADRISKYVMIAGGGGGGGAKPGSGTVVGTADGGAGGNLSSALGTVGGSNVVSGTYFAGTNGKSAGTSTSYIGKGGTYEPGATADSWWGLTDAEAVLPDDWFGTVGGNGGAGGSGELRGGGGGAGYAGGSGGLMTSALIASNVGGGGGGSSFIANSVNNENIVYSDLGDATAFLAEKSPLDGGAMYITYLDGKDFSFLEGMTVEGCFSEYIVPVFEGFQASQTAENELVLDQDVIDENHSHEKAMVSGVSLLDADRNLGGELNITVTFTYSDGFLGGNNVPILNRHDTSYHAPIILTTAGGESVTVDLGKSCGYVNMPLKIHVHTHNQESNSPGTAFVVNSLFYDEFAFPYDYDENGNPLGSIRDHLAELKASNHINSYQYDHILAIGDYQVYNSGGDPLDANDVVTPNTTTAYRVTLPVQIVPASETGYAEIGKRIEAGKDGWLLLSGTATITVLGSRHELLGKFMVTYKKDLVYEESDNTYTYTVNVKSEAQKEHNITPDTPGLNHVEGYNPEKPIIYEHIIEVDGCYLIQVWGGNGGKGGNGMFGWSEGGAGGKGGYVSGYVTLQKGDVIEIFVGINGTDSGSAFSVGSAGKHSRASLIRKASDGTVTETVLMIAGGGGGGGYGLGIDGSNGGDVSTTTTTGNANSANEYTAYDGSNGSNRKGGAAGSNYINSNYVTTDATGLTEDAAERFNAAGPEDYNVSAGAGTTYVKCLEVAESAVTDVVYEIGKALTDYGLSTTVSPYFKVEEITLLRAQTENITVPEYTLGQGTAVTVENIIPEVDTWSSGDDTLHGGSVDFDILIKLSPVEGFMGGNDVPLFVGDAVTLSHVQYEQEGVPVDPMPAIVLGADDAADYANVAINYTPPTLTSQKLFYQQEEEGYERSDLYGIEGEIPAVPAENAWLYDYVTVVNSVVYTDAITGKTGEVGEKDILKPVDTTEYTITMGIKPETGSVKANVVASQVAKTSSVTSIIIVGHEVIFDLDGLTHDMPDLHGKYVVEQNDNLVFTLAPEDAEYHEIPRSITVSIGDVPLESGYEYDVVSGKVTVDSSVITDTVTVTATAKGKSYTIHFIYGETPNATELQTKSEKYAAGSDITGAFHTKTAEHPSFKGYDFAWDWGEEFETAPTAMPTNDLWVIGTFTPHEYTVMVYYVYEDGSTADEDDVKTVTYGSDYAVAVPEIKGYLPYIVNGDEKTLTTTVQGTMGAADVAVYITYIPVQNTLTVIYRYPNGEQVGEAETYTFDGDTYSGIAVKTLEGYTQSSDGTTPEATWTTLSGSISENGNIVTVYYIPNSYTVTFTVDGTLFEERDVVFGGTYGYLSDGSYRAFGYPAKDHHTFEGWYLGNTDTQITEESVVTTAADHEIVAKMTKDTFTVTVKYQYENGTQAFPDAGGSFNYGDSYSFVSHELDGYTPDIAVVEGTVVGHNLVVIVTYTLDYSEEPRISVTVDWGTLSFSFAPGVWDPETHTYGAPTYTPTVEGGNTVTVTNNDSYIERESTKIPIQIIAGYSYEPKKGYEALDAYYTEDAAGAGQPVTGATVSNGAENAKTLYVWIEGNFDPRSAVANTGIEPYNGTIVYGVGTCKVTITAGGEEQ